MGRVLLVCVVWLAANGCDLGGHAPNAAHPVAPVPSGSLPVIGRFQLLAVPARGDHTGSVLRMDTSTGETWQLDLSEQPRWHVVPDNLVRVGTYNPGTKSIDWHTRTPDGRDLSQLSKDELIRMLTAYASVPPSQDPKDPLALFQAEQKH